MKSNSQYHCNPKITRRDPRKAEEPDCRRSPQRLGWVVGGGGGIATGGSSRRFATAEQRPEAQMRNNLWSGQLFKWHRAGDTHEGGAAGNEGAPVSS